MGLLDSAFWCSWVLSEVIMAVIHTALVVGTGTALGLRVFTTNSTLLVSTLLFMADLAIMSVGFLVASFMHKADSAVPAGFSVFLSAWMLQMVISNGFPYDPVYDGWARRPFNIFPWTLLGKGFSDLAKASGVSGYMFYFI